MEFKKSFYTPFGWPSAGENGSKPTLDGSVPHAPPQSENEGQYYMKLETWQSVTAETAKDRLYEATSVKAGFLGIAWRPLS